MRSSTASIANSVRAAALLAALTAFSVSAEQPATPVATAAPTPAEAVPSPPAAGAKGQDRYSCSAKPWSGDDVRFVNDMLLKWRPDYRKLSVGEFRVYARDVLLGLQPPGDRYAIETGKRGSIVFERKDGDILCTIRRP